MVKFGEADCMVLLQPYFYEGDMFVGTRLLLPTATKVIIRYVKPASRIGNLAMYILVQFQFVCCEKKF